MTLAETVATTREALTANPAAGQATFRANTDLVGLTEVDVRVRGHRFKADEPESLGGTDVAANPVEYVLAALGACHAITYRVWGEHLGIGFDDVQIRVEGDIDVRGFFGVDDAVRPGVSDIRVAATLRGTEPLERYEELHRQVEEHCPVQDMLTGSVNVKAELTVEG